MSKPLKEWSVIPQNVNPCSHFQQTGGQKWENIRIVEWVFSELISFDLGIVFDFEIYFLPKCLVLSHSYFLHNFLSCKIESTVCWFPSSSTFFFLIFSYLWNQKCGKPKAKLFPKFPPAPKFFEIDFSCWVVWITIILYIQGMIRHRGQIPEKKPVSLDEGLDFNVWNPGSA